VGIATNIPFSGNSNKSSATVEGHAPRPGQSPRGVYSYGVAGDYFHAMGQSLVAGRFLTAGDAASGARVCVVDDALARRYWPAGGAVGHRVFAGPAEGPDAEAFTIAGVVASVKQAGLTDDDSLGALYYPYEERFDSALYVVIRSTLPPPALGDTLQHAVRRIDPELPVNNMRSMDSRIAASLVTRRSPAVLAALFASIALLLTTVGTYGVISYAVALRRREIGLRMALGARPAQVRRQFVALALRLLAVGTLLGVAGAWAVGQVMQNVLFKVPAFDPLVVGTAAGVLVFVCLAACLISSERAARVSPVEALAEL
jgi:putative ABC transport system permease protein